MYLVGGWARLWSRQQRETVTRQAPCSASENVYLPKSWDVLTCLVEEIDRLVGNGKQDING